MIDLSVIIPLTGGSEAFERTLLSVLENRPANCEIIVPHPGPYDDPYRLADEVTFSQLPADAEIAQLLNRGVDMANGRIVHVLQCGAEVTEGWAAAAMERFADSSIAAVAPLIVQEGGRRIVSAGVCYGAGGTRRVAHAGRKRAPTVKQNRRLRRTRIDGPSLTAGFYRRDLLLALQGFDTSVGTEFADVDLARSLQTVGYAAALEPDCVVVGGDEAHTRIDSFTRGRNAQRLFWRHIQAAGLTKSMLLHVFSVLLTFLRFLPGSLPALAGRLIASCELRSYRQHHAMLDAHATQKAIIPLPDSADSTTPSRRAA